MTTVRTRRAQRRTASPSTRQGSSPGEPLVPDGFRPLLITLVVLAVALAAVGASLEPVMPSPLAVGLLALALTAGEAFVVDLPYRRAGIARFALSDAALAAGLMLARPNEIVLAALITAVTSQLVERASTVRLSFNVVQYVASASAAALAVNVLASTGEFSLRLFGATAAGMLLFLLCNTLSVSAIIALSGEGSRVQALRRMIPTAALLTLGSLALGLLAVLLLDTYPWAVPALGVPLVLLFTASRQEVRAQVDRERSAAYVAVEQRLGELGDPSAIPAVIAGGARRVLGCSAAVYSDGRWEGEVPEGSGPCPVDPQLEVPLVTQGSSLGPAVAGRCAAIGLGGGVLVVWRGELGVTSEAEAWLERLSRSGRVHFERAGTAAELEQERATLRAMVDGTRDGICVLDDTGVVRLWNPAMATLAGTLASEAIGNPVRAVLGDGPWAEDGVHDVLRSGDRTWRVSVAGLDSRGHRGMRVAVVHDVTSERRAARMKDDMLAVVSHELRTPLTPIKASAQLLRLRGDQLRDRDREELLARIEERADHLTRLVGDLLLVGQLSSASLPAPHVDSRPTDLTDVLSQAVSRQRASRPGHTIALSCPETVLCWTDPVRLSQVIESLVDNACKFSESGSRVDVELETDADVALVRVRDQGRGIPPEDVERVFERFERVDDPLLMTTSGAGLGLFIVRELVTALGGTVTIDSVLGAGTTVTVRLPLRLDGATQRPVTPVA
jgi:signal transduction histidine kinase